MKRTTIVAALATLLACAGRPTVPPDTGEAPEWPPGEARVRLESVLQMEGAGAGGIGRLLQWVGGGDARPLFERPYAAAWDDEILFVTDPGARSVVRIAPEAMATAAAEGLFESPIGVAVCTEGVVVTDASLGAVALLGPDLSFVRWIAEGLDRPTGVACEGDRVFVVETGKHQLIVYEPDGSLSRLGGRGEGGGEFNYPTSVTVADGWLWVGDTLNFRVQKLDASSWAFDGGFGRLGDAAGDMPRIKGVAVDNEGHAWVSDAHLDRVSLYTSIGELLLSLGGAGVEPGRFSFPAGIAAHPDGRVAVVDSLNRRIQVFRVVPETGGSSTGDGSR